LTALGYEVIPDHEESGRALYPKVLKKQKHYNTNVGIFSDYITADFPLIGIEPSAILTFRDEHD
jgi:hypothetical protein